MQLGVETNFDSHIRVVEEARLQGNMHLSIFHLYMQCFNLSVDFLTRFLTELHLM